MALALRMNGAPLSGALFVSNPAPRKAKANKAKVKANGRKRKTSARKRKGLLARAIARLRANTRGKARSTGKAGRQSAVSRALARLRARRNTSHLSGMVGMAGKGKVKANRRRRSRKAGRRNLALATDAMFRGGNAPAVLNAANEIAVFGFLRNRIGFLEMTDMIEKTLAHVPFLSSPTLDDYFESDGEARNFAASLMNL